MPRRKRVCTGGYVYHALNRAVAREKIFKDNGDYAAFEKVVGQALERVPVRLLSYCLMPNHWHLVLWPKRGRDEDLSEFMRWMTVTHTQRWHAHHGTAGTGSLYQGRFKSFPIQGDEHFLTVCRYVERNALRANLVTKAEDWRWGSLWRRAQGAQTEGRESFSDGSPGHVGNRASEKDSRPLALTGWPVPIPRQWTKLVNTAQTEAELEAIRKAIKRGRPFGDDNWTTKTAERLDLQSTLRPRGRPRHE